MIRRESNGIYETEQMTVNDGFVIAENYESLSIPSYQGTFSVPAFHVLKIHEGHPLVLNNNGGGIGVYPKRDFDAMQGSDATSMRFPAEWARDRVAHDLASFFLTPVFEIPKKSSLGKIAEIPDKIPSSKSCLLSYAEHGMHISKDNQRVCHVMPSAVPNYFFHWLMERYNFQYFDNEAKNWTNMGGINLAVDPARDVANKVNKLLEERFGVGFLLQGH